MDGETHDQLHNQVSVEERPMTDDITEMVAADGTVFKISPITLDVLALKRKVHRYNKILSNKSKRALKTVPLHTLDRVQQKQWHWNRRHRYYDVYREFSVTLDELGNGTRTREAVRQQMKKAKLERGYRRRSPMEIMVDMKPMSQQAALQMQVNLLNAKFTLTSNE